MQRGGGRRNFRGGGGDRKHFRGGGGGRGHPPWLKGKDIGLFYKNKHKATKNKEQCDIYLRIPRTVVMGVHKCLDRIENIARQRNIYLEPVKSLQFVDTPRNLDTPLHVPKKETITYYHHKDNDEIIVKKEEDSDMKNFNEPEMETERKPMINSSIKTVTNESQGIFVSNNYHNNPSSSGSKPSSTIRANMEFKYEYQDIITGSFASKLDECLSNGIDITLQSEGTESLNRKLKENIQVMLTKSNYNKMMEFRKTLPAYKKRQEVIDVINNNQVIVISGETGCGKSTQIPQLILDEAINQGKGANVKILVTEPRRIAASSLANRVAQERAESLGTSTGYAVRLESVPCRERGSIKFCTTGVLLVELELNQALGSYSHVILDEVHERDTQIDLAMCMLKQILKKRRDLKLILMSATIDAESLSKYYNNCPMIHIEGLAYPVEDIYLEHILQMTKFQLPNSAPKLNFAQPKPWHKHVKKGREDMKTMEKDIQYKANIAPWLESIKHTLDPEVYQTLKDSKIEELNYDLILQLLLQICRGDPGAILVFLPGIGEISKLIGIMNQSHAFPSTTHEIFALHSKLPTLDQNKIFERPPDGVRKIIIATNIAETSITIDDIVYVVDCGKIKYSGLDVDQNLATLKVEWIAKANMRQRRGRAGRCQPGICYHLFSSHRAQILEDRLLPELQRSNLLEPVLCIKRLRLGLAEEALNMVPAVPAEKTIRCAVKHLQSIGALDEKETLTPLGWHVARLPVHPAAGKLLVLGALFGCLDRAASVAAVWGFKEPFQMVMGKEEEVDQARRDLALGEPSDHVAISEAVIQWERSANRKEFARQHFISYNTVKLLSDMKKQFAENLKQMGFLYSARITSERENRNSNNLSLFKALIAASLYPNIGNVRWYNEKEFNPNKPMRIKVYTPEDGTVNLHPSSVMATRQDRRQRAPICTNVGANWLVYCLKHRSTDLFLLDVTCVYTLPLLFFGELNFTNADNPDYCTISISSEKVCCKRETAQLLFQVRSLLDKVLASKIMHTVEHTPRSYEFEEEVLNAVIKLITAEDERTQYLDAEDDDDDRFF